MLILRRVVFYTFLLMYLVLCPGLLLYASGYIFDPLTREVARTGLIHLASIPPGAAVYLERSRFIQKTPATLEKLYPGDYRVTIDLPGYRTWSQKVSVKPGKATAFDKVLLLPGNLSSKTVLEGGYKQIYPLPGTDLLLVAGSSELDNFQLYNIKEDKALPLVGAGSLWRSFSVISIYHEDESKSFIVYGGGLWERKYLLVNVKADVPVITDITKLLARDPLLIEWDPLEPDQIFAIYPDAIDRINTAMAAIYPRDIEDVKGCGFQNNRVYLMTGDDRFIKYARDKARAEPFLLPERFDPRVLSRKVFYRILAPEENRVFLLGENGSLLSNHPPYTITDKGVLGVKFYDHGRTFMSWTASTVAIFDAGDEKKGSKGGAGVKTVFRTGQDIRQCFWALDASHIVCNDNDRILLIEVELQGEEHSEFIANIKKGTSIFYSNATGCVYFLDEGGRFQRIQLVPPENLVQKFLNEGD